MVYVAKTDSVVRFSYALGIRKPPENLKSYAFIESYTPKYEKAADCLIKDRETCWRRNASSAAALVSAIQISCSARLAFGCWLRQLGDHVRALVHPAALLACFRPDLASMPD